MAQVAPDVKLGEVFNPVDQNSTGLNKDALNSLDLSHPPPGFFRVEVFFYVNSVSRVNLAAMNAQVDVGVCLNWKDPRMVGFPFTDTVPSNLWGPMVNLWNCEGMCFVFTIYFVRFYSSVRLLDDNYPGFYI